MMRVRDPHHLCDCIEPRDAACAADYVLHLIEKAFFSISENPQPGACPFHIPSRAAMLRGHDDACAHPTIPAVFLYPEEGAVPK